MSAHFPHLAATLLTLAGCHGVSEPELHGHAPLAEQDMADAPAEEEAAGEPMARGVRPQELAKEKGGETRKAPTSGDERIEPEEAEPEAPAARTWFPETLLFRPLLETGPDGRASLDVTVPDQLTTWRVLALGHTRTGQQGGAETTFASVMPAHLDLVEPPTLMVGDRLRLPVQVVNQGEEPLDARLTARVSGTAARGELRASVIVPPGSTTTRYLELRAVGPGEASVEVSLDGVDAVRRAFHVLPVGRRVEHQEVGTLAGPRDLESPAAPGAEGPSRLALAVYPGPVSVLDAELARPDRSGGVADAAYRFALTGVGAELARRMGHEPDEKEIRKARLLAWQALVRETRAPGFNASLLGLAATRPWPHEPMARDLADRLADSLCLSQSQDGSFPEASGGAGVEVALLAAAEASRACKGRHPLTGQRAAGYVARHGVWVRDPYVAAALLASGLVEEPLSETLEKLLLDNVTTLPDGSRAVSPLATSRRLDGDIPDRIETTALAIQALAGRPEHAELIEDMGAYILASWRPDEGFGDGRAGLRVLDALPLLFVGPLPESSQVTLLVDGAPVVSERLTLGGDFAPLTAGVEVGPGSHHLRISADPPVAALAFTLTRTSWVSWEEGRGDTLRVTAPTHARVGEPAKVTVEAALPAGAPFRFELGLPAGFTAREGSLEALVTAGAITGFQEERGRLVLHAPALSPGEPFSVTFQVVPELAGRLGWGEASVTLDDASYPLMTPMGTRRATRRASPAPTTVSTTRSMSL